MSLPELCIRRPVMTCLLMITVVMLGLAGYRQLWEGRLDALHTEIARGKKVRR